MNETNEFMQSSSVCTRVTFAKHMSSSNAPWICSFGSFFLKSIPFSRSLAHSRSVYHLCDNWLGSFFSLFQLLQTPPPYSSSYRVLERATKHFSHRYSSLELTWWSAIITFHEEPIKNKLEKLLSLPNNLGFQEHRQSGLKDQSVLKVSTVRNLLFFSFSFNSGDGGDESLHFKIKDYGFSFMHEVCECCCVCLRSQSLAR